VQGLARILRAEMQAGNHAAAKTTAAILAPYQTPRLSASDVRVRRDVAERTDAELMVEIAQLEARLGLSRTIEHEKLN
jgi:hypothetical protein